MILFSHLKAILHMGGSRVEGGGGAGGPFLRNTGLDSLKNHKATNLKPVCNARPLSARQRNAI